MTDMLRPGALGVAVYAGPAMPKPCDNCPFKAIDEGKGYLTAERIEGILFAVCMGAPFWCHKTVHGDKRTEWAEDEPATYARHYRMCAGAIEHAERIRDEGIP